MTVKAMIRPLNFEGFNIPEHTQGALSRYIEDGYQPGGFLTSVLCNDLMGAVARADGENIWALKDICQFVYNCVPSDAWGSAAKMDAYMEKVWAMKEGK